MNNLVYGFEPNLGGLVGLVVTVLLPILVGLVTRRTTAPFLKASLLMFLSALKVTIEGWMESANTGVDFNILALVYTFVINFVIAVGIHFGLYRSQNSSGTSVATWAENHGVK